MNLDRLQKQMRPKDRQALKGLLCGRKPVLAIEPVFEDAKLNEIDALISKLDPDDVIGHLTLSAKREDLKLQLGLEGRL